MIFGFWKLVFMVCMCVRMVDGKDGGRSGTGDGKDGGSSGIGDIR